MARFAFERTRVVNAPPDKVWAVVSEAGRYHEVVENLVSTEIVSGSGVGMARRCLDDKGREWDEACTLWEEGHRYRMTVDVDTYPASFRAIFRSLEGTWSVAPVEKGTALGIRFEGETKLGPLGKAAVTAMGRDTTLEAILDGYERQLRNPS